MALKTRVRAWTRHPRALVNRLRQELSVPDSPGSSSEAPSSFEDFTHIDQAGLVRELRMLELELRKEAGEEDLRHLRKIEAWGRACTALGFGTAWLLPNPLSALLISQGQLTRWLLGHHISHRGYDRVPGVPSRYTSAVFGKGSRRLLDWMDWIHPDAWHQEHDILHHYSLGEDEDPDLLERNTAWMREQNLPMWQRKALIAFLALHWKWFYYAPSTMNALQRERAKQEGRPEPEPVNLLNPLHERGRELYLKALLPNAALRFGVIPALYAPLGPIAVANVFLNTVLAEWIGNLHAFVVIGPNHTADDLYRFTTHVGSRGEFLLRQIIGSVNYRTGTDLIDWPQMWLNYQIEHHIWPDMTMLQYRKAQPRVKALCERYGIPYAEEHVFRRADRMLKVIFGTRRMRWARTSEADLDEAAE